VNKEGGQRGWSIRGVNSNKEGGQRGWSIRGVNGNKRVGKEGGQTEVRARGQE
jgi:hypothetical protein